MAAEIFREVAAMKLKFKSLWSWIWFLIGALYFILPLYATLDFSLRMERDTIGFKAYRVAFADPKFVETFARSNILAVITIIVSIILIVPTAYWVRLRLPQASTPSMCASRKSLSTRRSHFNRAPALQESGS